MSIGVGSNLFIYVIMNISMVTGLMQLWVYASLISYGGSVMYLYDLIIGFKYRSECKYKKIERCLK